MRGQFTSTGGHLGPPRRLIDIYEARYNDRPRLGALWDALGVETAAVMAEGVKTLAMIWESAWVAGGGNRNAGRMDRDALRKIYENPNFLRSVTVHGIMQEITYPTPLGP